jgi:hypothetical protein
MLAMSRGIPVMLRTFPRLGSIAPFVNIPNHYRMPMRTVADASVSLPTITHIKDKENQSFPLFPKMLHPSRMLYSTIAHTTERGPAGLLNNSCNSGGKPKVVQAVSFAEYQDERVMPHTA